MTPVFSAVTFSVILMEDSVGANNSKDQTSGILNPKSDQCLTLINEQSVGLNDRRFVPMDANKNKDLETDIDII